jgi:GNAT superfamily N-acetyltransferase
MVRQAHHERKISLATMEFAARRATESDADAMAEAHRDSIRAIGPRFYPAKVVDDWCSGIDGALYVDAMARGEVFFVATGTIDGRDVVFGFASDYRIEGTQHGTSVYVRGAVARHGVGSALLGLAERHGRERGARTIRIEASLAGVEFYQRHGYVELSRGETRLRSGKAIAVVFMEKRLAEPNHA